MAVRLIQRHHADALEIFGCTSHGHRFHRPIRRDQANPGEFEAALFHGHPANRIQQFLLVGDADNRAVNTCQKALHAVELRDSRLRPLLIGDVAHGRLKKPVPLQFNARQQHR